MHRRNVPSIQPHIAMTSILLPQHEIFIVRFGRVFLLLQNSYPLFTKGHTSNVHDEKYKHITNSRETS